MRVRGDTQEPDVVTKTGARTILIAEEGDDSREAIEFWLHQAGFIVLIASNAGEVLDHVERRPDVIVLDTALPGGSGFDLATHLKRDPSTAAIPIIHIAPGVATGEWRAQGLEAGADAFLTRPVEPQELIATVRALLRVRAAEEEVRVAAEQWAATFDAITDAVCIIDERGYLERCNDAADELLATIGDSSGHRTFGEVFPPPGDAPGDTIAHVLASGEPFEYEARVDDRWFAVRLDPIVRREQVDPAVVAVIANVTSRHESDQERARLLVNAERARQEAERSRLEAEASRVEAEQASRAKSEFLATMSHELRTPLNAIDGYAELLELEVRGPITAAQREDIRRIRRSQKHLLSLINDVLNFVRLEAGTVRYQIYDFDLADAIRDVEVVTTPQLRAKRLRFTRADADTGLRVHADREKVEQVLVNLMTNAIKFTEPNGEIALECSGAGDQVTVRVRDTGRGIPADKLSVIFEPFVQVARSAAAPSEGVGLGLAISRDLSRAMGGDLVVESTMGKGSTFTLTLPAAQPAPRDRSSRREAPA
jgi:signal transduction histidine kinase/CheY-like chemotaxis protein